MAMPPVTVDSLFTVLMLSVSLICTHTEGPSPVMLRLHTIITFLPPDVHGEKHHTYSNVRHIFTYIISQLKLLPEG